MQILDRNGIVADIYSNLGYVYAKTHKDAEAIAYLSKAIELNPKLAKAYSSRGSVLSSKGAIIKSRSRFGKSRSARSKRRGGVF